MHLDEILWLHVIRQVSLLHDLIEGHLLSPEECPVEGSLVVLLCFEGE